MEYKIGDKVAVLDSDMEGIVRKVDKHRITVETTDGFEIDFDKSELIKYVKSSNLDLNSTSFNLSQVKREKEVEKRRNPLPQKKVKGEIPPPEFDLHIEKLAKNFRNMSNYEILNLQAETAKRHIEFAIRNRIPKIIFIHGVGEGVLKAELDFLLGRYEQIIFRDADFRKYGVGATEVVFKQSVK